MGELTQETLTRCGKELPGESVGKGREVGGPWGPSGLGVRNLRWGSCGGGRGLDPMTSGCPFWPVAFLLQSSL